MSNAELAAILSACFCALMSISTIALMSHALGKARKARDGAPIDDPSLDATDAAHPAWWRGTDHAAARWHIRTQEAELERDKLREDLKRIRNLVGVLTLESSTAREELREFKARLRRRAEAKQLRRDPLPCRTGPLPSRTGWRTKAEHERVMDHLRERARIQ